MESMQVLKVENLSIAFGGLKAVDELAFHINEGEIYGLIGPNGAGKTTVFNCITQFYRPDKGSVLFQTDETQYTDLVGKHTHDIIQLGLVRTFQNLEVISDLSLLDNLLVGSHIKYKTGFFAQMFRLKHARQEEAENVKKAEAILEFLGIEEKKYEFAGGQPYGILKKVELGRTLMSNPKLIILDEPAAGLNDTETMELSQLIKTIRTAYNCTILLVEHDMRLVMDICDRICAISFGKKLAEGTPLEIQSNKEVQEAYLGKAE